MGQLANTPSWGVLVNAPVEQVHEILSSFGADLILRTNNGWTSAFYMAAADTSDDEAAERLRSLGLVPLYKFDFSKYQFSVSCWDGERWTLLGKPRSEDDFAFVESGSVLHEVGLQAPYCDEGPDARKSVAVEVREAIVIKGATVDLARLFAGDRVRVEAGPLGAIVYDPDPGTRSDLLSLGEEGRAFEVTFYPRSSSFRLRVMRLDTCVGTFKPGQTRTWDGTPFLASVEGETDPEAIVEKLGISCSFLART